MHGRADRPGHERGMVTAELAIGVLGVVFLTLLATWSVLLAVTQTRCGDVAAEVARELARGDVTAAHEAEGRAPKGARLTVDHRREVVVVTVRTDAAFGPVGPVHLIGRSVATLEPGVSG